MLISRGKGDWMLYLPFLLMLVPMLIMDKMLGMGNRGTGPAVVIGLLITGLFGIGLAIHARLRKPVWRLEQRTGRELFTREKHSLYWIGTEYWGVLDLVLAAVLFKAAF